VFLKDKRDTTQPADDMQTEDQLLGDVSEFERGLYRLYREAGWSVQVALTFLGISTPGRRRGAPPRRDISGPDSK
jgi:hypothetical protein